MAYQALARKYRPQTFSEMIGQGAVVKTLQNALALGKLHPAYIFSGIRGVGKTTAARLFAKGLNCEKGPTPNPCGECASCQEIKRAFSMDVLEIDAATNTQVEKIRDIIDASRYTPSRDRFRVFIIDEVHMLSGSSFNALLKTLEEPPPHAVFLLATTEAHKIPETIHSRAQHFQFRRVPEHQVADFLAYVCTQERLTAEAGALSLIAKSGEGSVRDSLTLLDRILAYADGPITEAAAVEILGVVGREGLLALAESLAAGDAAAVPGFVDRLLERGQSLERFLSDLTSLVRNMVHARLGVPGADGDDERLRACASRFSEEDLLRLWDLLLATQQRLKGTPDADALLELQLVKAALLPRILPLDRLMGRVADPPREDPPRPGAPRPVGLAPVPSEPRGTDPSEGAKAPPEPPPEGFRFKAIIPFKRMDEDEARSFEDQNDDRIHRFREQAARRLPLLVETLKGAALSVDPDGVLHVALPPADATGAALLGNRERREALEAVAREAGLPGPVAVEGSSAAASESTVARDSLVPSRDPAVDNVLRVFGGRVVKVTAPPPEPDDGGPHGEPE